MSRLAPLLLVALLGAPTLARAESLQSFTRRLTAAGRGLKTLEARFVQRKHLALFSAAVTSKGRVRFRHPDRLRWEILPPDASVLLVRGQQAQLWTPGQRPRALDLQRHRTLGTLVQQMLVWLGARPAGDLSRHYQVSLKQSAKVTILGLVPRQAVLRKRISRVQLRFGPDLALQQIQLQHPDGDRTEVDFEGLRRNHKLPPDTFQAPDINQKSTPGGPSGGIPWRTPAAPADKTLPNQ